MESFTQAQRFAVKKSLTKSFRHFLTYKKDHEELLLYLIDELARDSALINVAANDGGRWLRDEEENANRNADDDDEDDDDDDDEDDGFNRVMIRLDNLEARASQMGIRKSVGEFLTASRFVSSGYKLRKRLIRGKVVSMIVRRR